MVDAFTRLDVSDWGVVSRETGGTGAKSWILDPNGQVLDPTSRWLFKPVTFHGAGHRQNGDWTEKIAGEIALVLGIPAATVELGVLDGTEGVLSRNIRDQMSDMFSGRLWMDSLEENSYISHEARVSRRINGATRGYTLENVVSSLRGLAPPSALAPEMSALSAVDVFVGYLLLDALIANRDRHEENWSVLVPTMGSGRAQLAASYDHEGSLGYQLTDEYRSAVLAGARSGGIEGWASKATAWRFEGWRKSSLVELAIEVLLKTNADTRHYWVDRLDKLSWQTIQEILNRCEGMSVVSRTFALELMKVNAERLKDEYAGRS